MEERKASYNFITEKVKHVYFNSFGNSMNAVLLQVIKLTARYTEIWNMSNTDVLTSNGNVNWLDMVGLYKHCCERIG